MWLKVGLAGEVGSAGVPDSGLPVPSGEFEPCVPTEGLGDVVPRVEGTA